MTFINLLPTPNFQLDLLQSWNHNELKCRALDFLAPDILSSILFSVTLLSIDFSKPFHSIVFTPERLWARWIQLSNEGGSRQMNNAAFCRPRLKVGSRDRFARQTRSRRKNRFGFQNCQRRWEDYRAPAAIVARSREPRDNLIEPTPNQDLQHWSLSWRFLRN